MSAFPIPDTIEAATADLVTRACAGDRAAIESLIETWRKPLFGYIHRLIGEPRDTDDLFQDVMVRLLESLPTFRREAKFQTWLFGIATHVCLDHLRARKRWRVEAQLIGEQETIADPAKIEEVVALLTQPDAVFEIREHIAFCFTCVARTLEPDQQAALMLREVLGFSAEEAATILDISEPIFRHRLSAARAAMVQAYDGLCQLINKSGVCYQCAALREFVPEQHRGSQLVQITVAPGVDLTPDNLFDARLQIVRKADLENGRSRAVHRSFYLAIATQEQKRD
jgi:RNA polymerase sigma-70 factor (ECF subfamily)